MGSDIDTEKEPMELMREKGLSVKDIFRIKEYFQKPVRDAFPFIKTIKYDEAGLPKLYESTIEDLKNVNFNIEEEANLLNALWLVSNMKISKAQLLSILGMVLKLLGKESSEWSWK